VRRQAVSIPQCLDLLANPVSLIARYRGSLGQRGNRDGIVGYDSDVSNGRTSIRQDPLCIGKEARARPNGFGRKEDAWSKGTVKLEPAGSHGSNREIVAGLTL
jgi:hypothetical protein